MAEEMRTSTRDLRTLHDRVATWLSGRTGGPVEVSELSRPSANGMSSETLFFTASWAGRRPVRCVARLAPETEAVPVFPHYDLGAQFEVMRLARERAGVPAPRALWFEPDPGALGTPFFVMEREDGDVPPDVMPYTFEGWLLDAPPGRRRELQDASVGLLAALHDTPFTRDELSILLRPDPGRGGGLRAHVDAQRAYYGWAHGDHPIPLLERAFDWLEAHWPDDPGPDVLTWGDARIGNVMYQDFRPVAVLDWEMAAVGPRELDLAWMIFLHRFFQDLTEAMGLPGLPDFMRRDDVCRTYQELTGHQPANMDFHLTYAALRHGVIMARVWRRRIHFGEQAMPDDPDDLVLHRTTLERMIAH
ncbi:phosphotransferase family protein [Nonomuraea roseoviolacea]|uniref:Aminoglycoside phosphotransferase (APT) family kinase protein n=1 Tax=Nonomuraea roseoviolacea subsp. carminata TaxID=160689 RepID=A0ABT1JS65_9ACTN|nr:phosphotransferase family protein [Nonomuraea roseoviolacea]MCP2344440.1 aminoglycoside phosphotransferase (APT) family kinase protein [Nonomuraea roseoviolacea subsp. carminata]